MLTNEQKKKIEALVDRMRSEVEWCDEYYTSNEDNPHADYVASVGYGGELMHEVEDALKRHNFKRQLEEDEYMYIEALVNGYHPNKHNARAIVNKIIDITNLCFEPSYWANDLELCSMSLGEIEHQLDDDLFNELEALSDDEMEQFIRDVRSYVYYEKGSRFIHVDHGYSRWYLELNVDKLNDLMKSTPIESISKLSSASQKKIKQLEVIK